MGGSANQLGRRIAVVGTSGCGKTYLAKTLAARLNIPYICNDSLIWRADWVLTPQDEKEKLFREAMSQPQWTFDGNIGWMRSPEDRFVARAMDTIIWLDLPRWEVWPQVVRRTIKRIRTREALWGGNRETWRTAFFSNHSVIIWSLKSFNLRRKQYRNLFSDPKIDHVRRIRLGSVVEVNQWLAEIGIATAMLVNYPVMENSLNARNAHVGV